MRAPPARPPALARKRAPADDPRHAADRHEEPPRESQPHDAAHDGLHDDARQLLARSEHSLFKRCAISLGLMLVVVCGAIGGGLYWRMGTAPLDLPFLTSRVLAEIGANLPAGYGAELGQVSVGRGEQGLAFVLSNLAVQDASGAVLASAPRVMVEVAAMPLLFGSVQPRRIVVDGATAALTIALDGHIGLRTGGDLASLGGAGEITVPAMLGGLDALLEAARSIDMVEMRNASLIVEDKAFGRDKTYRDIALGLRRTAAEGGLAFSLAVGGGTVNATIEGRGSGARLVDVQARGIALREVLLSLAPGAKPPDLTATLDGVARLRVAEDGTIDQATLSVDSNGGTWTVEPDVRPFVFDNAGLSLRWDAASHMIIVDRVMVRAGEGLASFQGRMIPPATAGGADWLLELDAPGMTIAGHGPDDVPLKLDVASIRGRYNPETRRFGIDKGEFNGPNASLALAGSMSFDGDTPGIGLGIAAGRMSTTAVKRYWPFFAAAPARDWVVDHTLGGVLESGTLSLAIPPNALVPVNGKVPPLPEGAVRGAMRFSGATVSVVDTLPPVTNIDATIDFTARRFTLVADNGTVDLGDQGKIAISDGLYEIADLVPKPANQHVAFRMKGKASAVAALMTREPLSASTRGVPVNPGEISGAADLDVSMDFPTVNPLKPADFRYAISGQLSDLDVANFEGQSLQDGELKLAIEPSVILLTGKATLSGLPAHIDYRKAPNADPQITIGLTLDDAARKKRGFDFGDALAGPVGAEVRVERKDGGQRFGVDLDLTDARVKDLLPGWQKAPGRPGKASFVFIPGSDGGKVDDLALDAGPVQLRGDITLASDGGLRKAVMSSVRLSSGDDASATVEAVGDGWKATMKGASFDLRPTLLMLQRRGTGGAADRKGSLGVSVDLQNAIGFGEETLTGLDLAFDLKGSTIRKFALKGNFGAKGIVGGMREGTSGASEIYVETIDAGSLLRFLDYYSKVDAGILQAALTPRLDTMAGQIFIRDFAVRNEPALGQYRSSLKRSDAAVDLPAPPEGGDSAKFAKLRLTFARSPTRLDLSEAVVWGPDIGANLSGDIDYAEDKVNLTGTFVPAYALNNMFSRIPVIGAILGGGANEGLFAINFKVSGSVGAPTLTINPLSAIAPGFLRKLFEFQKQ